MSQENKNDAAHEESAAPTPYTHPNELQQLHMSNGLALIRDTGNIPHDNLIQWRDVWDDNILFHQINQGTNQRTLRAIAISIPMYAHLFSTQYEDPVGSGHDAFIVGISTSGYGRQMVHRMDAIRWGEALASGDDSSEGTQQQEI